MGPPDVLANRAGHLVDLACAAVAFRAASVTVRDPDRPGEFEELASHGYPHRLSQFIRNEFVERQPEWKIIGDHASECLFWEDMPGFAQSDVARFLRRHGLANGTSMPLVDGDGQLIGAAHFSLSDNEVPGYARGLLTRMREDLSEVAQAASQARRSRLTPREIEVLRLLAQGLTNSQVAAQLVISRRTASTHVENILAKLEVAGRLQAAMLASRLGLLG